MLHASCHCGAVRLEIADEPSSLTQCNCSICGRYGAIWAYYDRRSVVVAAPPEGLGTYRIPDGAIDFFHCRRCGCLTHYELVDKRPDESHLFGLNARMIEEREAVASVPIRMLDGANSWRVIHETAEPHLFISPVEH